MANCPFCIKTNEEFILETSNFAVIYNLSPILPGHCLLIPKDHKESIFELTEEELAEFMIFSRKLAELLKEVFDTDAFNWAVQEREPAGQSVSHLHMHVVPRKIGDLENPGAWYSELERSENMPIDSSDRFKLSEGQLHDLTKRLKKKAKEYFAGDDFFAGI